MLHFVQHDNRTVIPSNSEESRAWMLRLAQHDKTDRVIPSASEESMTLFVMAKVDASLRLRSVQHDKTVV